MRSITWIEVLPGDLSASAMEHACTRIARAAQPAFDVEDTAEVTEHHGIGPAGLNVGALLVNDRRGDVAVLDRERATESAARLAVLHFGQRHTRQLAQQFAWLLLDAQLTQAGTGIVIGDTAGKSGIEPVNLCHVDEEIGQFEDALPQALVAAMQFRIVAQQVLIVLANHAAAGAGRHHHVVEHLELAQEFLRQVT